MTRVKALKLKSIVIPMLFISILLSGCTTPPSKEGLSTQTIMFDTIISIQIWGTEDAQLLSRCVDMCEDYENLFSRTIDTSEISQINAAKGQPVKVSDETLEVIQKGLYYSELSGGRFDITIAPLSILWDFKNNTGILPVSGAIEEAKSHVNYKNVQIQDHTVTLSDPDAMLDLGGIAKGYIADKLKEYLISEGVKHGIISLGGNVLTIGKRLDGTDFRVGIQKPFDKQNTSITSVNIQDQSVVSSGIYERYFEVDGVLYHHILDPETGFPIDNNLFSVTIISEKSVDGDALSTTCLMLGLEEGMKLIEKTEGVEAVFITDDEQLHKTKGLRSD